MRIRTDWVAPFFLLFLGYALSLTGGQYRALPIILVTIMFLAFCVVQCRETRVAIPTKAWGVIGFFFACRLLQQPRILYGHFGFVYAAICGLLGIAFLAAFAAIVYFFSRPPKEKPREKPKEEIILRCFYCAAITLALAYLLVPTASPSPHIDVFSTTRLAASYLIHGSNPYGQFYPDIYNGAYDYHPAFPYWPGVLIAMTPFQFLLGDIRYALVASIFLSAWGVFVLCRRLGHDPVRSGWIALSWFSFPIGIFVVEESWIDPLLCAATVWMLIAMMDRRWVLSGLALGFLISVKQYGLVLVPVTGLWLFRRHGVKATLLSFGTALLLFLAILLPFALSHPSAFYESTIRQLIHQQFRSDSFSVVALLQNGWGISLSKGLVLGVDCLALAACLLFIALKKNTVHSWAAAMTMLLGVVFLMGKQAFANYYYFFAIFLLISLSSEGARQEKASA